MKSKNLCSLILALLLVTPVQAKMRHVGAVIIGSVITVFSLRPTTFLGTTTLESMIKPKATAHNNALEHTASTLSSKENLICLSAFLTSSIITSSGVALILWGARDVADDTDAIAAQTEGQTAHQRQF